MNSIFSGKVSRLVNNSSWHSASGHRWNFSVNTLLVLNDEVNRRISVEAHSIIFFVSGVSKTGHIGDLPLMNQNWVLTLKISAFSSVNTHQISIFLPPMLRTTCLLWMLLLSKIIPQHLNLDICSSVHLHTRIPDN